MSELTEFRELKDEIFRNPMQSPLSKEQRTKFTGLSYFPENAALRLTLALEKHQKPERVRFQTSTGDVQEYIRAGQVRFDVGGQPALLQVYLSSDGEGGYFLPFVDATAPKETYGGGRYLEPEELSDGRLLVDFNLAYNPYCAYNDSWSCPFPPPENRLKVRIEAGEKKFH